MKRLALAIMAVLALGFVLFAVFAIRTSERTSKHEHDWQLVHGRGINE